MSKVSLDYDSVDKGTPLEGLSIPALTRVALARFAGAVDDYNPMHLDDKVAVATGKTSVFASSNQVMGYVGRMVESWFAGASLRRYVLRMLKLVWPGDVLTCRGVIIDKRIENGAHVIDADVWADNQRGETVAKGRVIAVVPPRKGAKLTRSESSNGVVYGVPKAKRSATGGTAAASKQKTKKKPAAKTKKTTSKKVAKKR